MADSSDGASFARQGELPGESAADVRAALRRIGLQVIELRPLRRRWLCFTTKQHGWLDVFVEGFRGHLRRRRQPQRAELYDSLATMLESGLPLLEAVETVMASAFRRRSHWHSMLTELRERLRAGSALSQAMSDQPSWFDGTEVAMVNAGQHGGTLPTVLRNLADRHQHAGELMSKLTSALAYPTIVTVVGLGVTVFLSVKTLPALTAILASAKIQTPPLTAKVMAIGQFVASYWPWLVIGTPMVMVAALMLLRASIRRRSSMPIWIRRLCPQLVRRLIVARFAHQLAQLIQSGVPMVESLRVLGPTTSGFGGNLRAVVMTAAERIERGQELSDALDDPLWFDLEFRRLLDVGQASGELDQLLTRIAERYNRQARRLIDRAARLIEPFVILVLAALIGAVVMAAILPLLRLQEML